MMHFTSGGPTTEIPLVYDGGPNFRAVFPNFDCGVTVEYYFSIESTEGDMSFSPFSAPNVKWSGEAWSGYNAIFDDDFQSDTGWTVNAGAGTGNWIRVVPSGGGVRCDAGSDSDGSGMCYVTGNGADEDVDDGTTILTSPTLDGSADGAILSYDFWYNNGSNCGGADPQNDVFVIEISDNNGGSWQSLETIGPDGSEVNGGWITRDWIIQDIPNVTPNNTMRIRFTVGDLNAGSVIEAGVDSVHIGNFFCDEITCPEDLNGDEMVDVTDLLTVIAEWGETNSPADINGDNIVDVSDLLMVIAA